MRGCVLSYKSTYFCSRTLQTMLLRCWLVGCSDISTQAQQYTVSKTNTNTRDTPECKSSAPSNACIAATDAKYPPPHAHTRCRCSVSNPINSERPQLFLLQVQECVCVQSLIVRLLYLLALFFIAPALVARMVREKLLLEGLFRCFECSTLVAIPFAAGQLPVPYAWPT